MALELQCARLVQLLSDKCGCCFVYFPQTAPPIGFVCELIPISDGRNRQAFEVGVGWVHDQARYCKFSCYMQSLIAGTLFMRAVLAHAIWHS